MLFVQTWTDPRGKQRFWVRCFEGTVLDGTILWITTTARVISGLGRTDIHDHIWMWYRQRCNVKETHMQHPQLPNFTFIHLPQNDSWFLYWNLPHCFLFLMLVWCSLAIELQGGGLTWWNLYFRPRFLCVICFFFFFIYIYTYDIWY